MNDSTATTLLENNNIITTLAMAGSLAVSYILLEKLIKRQQHKKPFEELPMSPQSHWLFGHAKLMYDKERFPHSYNTLARDNCDSNGKTGYWLGPKRAVAIRNMEDVLLVLNRESNRNNIPIVSHYLAHIVGETNLLMLNGREWKIHRDAVTRTFTSSFLLQAQEDVYTVTRDLVETFSRKIDECRNAQESQKYWQVDVQPITKMVTMDCIGKAAFSTDFDCCKTLEAAPVVKAFEHLALDCSRRMKSPLNPFNYFYGIPTKENKRHQEQFSFLRGFIDDLLVKAQHEREASLGGGGSDHSGDSDGNEKTHNLLTRLVAAHKGGDNTETLIDVMSTILFASYDTTATTLTFALYLLSTHQKIQEDCVEEIRSLQAQNDSTRLSNAKGLVYISAVVKETLRLFPPAFQVSRTLSKPLELSGGFVAPKGIQVGIPIWVIHHDEEHFPNPDEMRPDRWVKRTDRQGWVPRNYREELKLSSSTEEGTIRAGNSEALLAFSAGGRSCPGSKFAFQETVIVLANLVKDLHFSPVPGFELKLGLEGIMPTTKGGMPLRVSKREPACVYE